VFIALSLANLCFFSVWGDLLSGFQLHYHMAMQCYVSLAKAGVARVKSSRLE
jgi:hypothetical protein